MVEYSNLLFEKKDGIGFVTINRPKALNALNKDVFDELSPLLDNIARDSEIKVVIISGSGEKSFVAGADIAYMLPMSSPEGKEWGEVGQGVFNKIEKLPQPVIAAINGFALGGGCELAMACDIRVASEKAKFGQPEVSLGIIPGFGGSQRLPRLVGKGRAKELLFTADIIDAQEAYRIGLVNKVAPPEELMNTAVEMAKKIMRHAPQFFVEGSHPAIVFRETFQAVQREIERRSKLKTSGRRGKYTNKYPFSGKLFCSKCGASFKRKSWGPGKYKKYVWICRERFAKGPKGCTTDVVHEERLQEAFVRVINRVIEDRDTFVKQMRENIEKTYHEKASTVDEAAINARVEELRKEMSSLVKLNLTAGVDTQIYAQEYNRITGEMEDLQSKQSVVTEARMARRGSLDKVQEIDKVFREMKNVRQFDEEIYKMLIERINVLNQLQVEFVLRAGVGVVEIL